MTSPYLTQPLRTLEQVIAEKLKRPIPVGNRPRVVAAPEPTDDEMPRRRMAVASGAAEGGDD
ncbi:MAG: hypothetical protein RIM84_11285 [Alphaproteobacteria bacterium]